MVLVQHILDPARKRLAVVSSAASVCDVAAILANPTTPLVVVCDDAGLAIGVISRTDVIKAIAVAAIDPRCAGADAIMTRAVLSCHVDQTLQLVWSNLSARSLRCAPILDHDGRPQGVVHARDLASALLAEVTYEEGLLRDYVLGIGYQ